MPRKADAYIIPHRRPDDSVEYLVRPSVVVVNGNHGRPKILFRNLTGLNSITFDLGGREAAPAPGAANPRRTNEDGADLFEMDFTSTAAQFSYSIRVNGVPAKGESDPVIIIDPPNP